MGFLKWAKEYFKHRKEAKKIHKLTELGFFLQYKSNSLENKALRETHTLIEAGQELRKYVIELLDNNEIQNIQIPNELENEIRELEIKEISDCALLGRKVFMLGKLITKQKVRMGMRIFIGTPGRPVFTPFEIAFFMTILLVGVECYTFFF